ncbi:magnesium transporter MRS2-I [Artemisia annua]|uniref:Magnesium transporter n=1 Tax=Artemisia annua TaxID=35608 RepID=A0A2U1NN50_ARTAN|nr:magnesium transporter MRS2-I [Artemisia annua]
MEGEDLSLVKIDGKKLTTMRRQPEGRTVGVSAGEGNDVLLRDPSDDNVIPVVEELRRRLPVINANQGELGGQSDVETGDEDESPFEFQALEVFLEAICSFHAARMTEIEIAAYPALDKLTSKISGHNLDRVHKLKSAMTRLTARVQKVRDELVRLLDDDNDMADLYLSRKLCSASPVSGSGADSWFLGSPTIGSKISRASRASVMTVHGDENDVEELAMLLEAYFMQIDETLNKLTSLRNYIDDTKAYIKIQRDNRRNQLIKLENFISSGNLCMLIYSLVTAIFGMNIPYKWNQDHGYMFKWVVILSGAFSAALFLLIVSYARLKRLV